jgi:choline monooxygenase
VSSLTGVRTLPAGDYRDADVHETERHAIFAREWLCLGPAAQVDAPGSYLAETVAGWPVIVVRDGDRVLRAFHNVCRHRAGPLVDDGCGTCRSFVCHYHGWSYELDGSLRSARDAGLDEAEVAGMDLFPVAATTWRGLLFVGFDPTVADIEDWLGEGFVAQCAAFPIEGWTPARRTTHTLACNWKTYTDNYLEGYHIPFVHPSLARSIDTSSYAVHVEDGWIRHTAETREGASTAGVWLYHWPNLALNVYEHGMSVERWLPTGSRSCELVLDYVFADTSPAAIARNQRDIDASTQTCLEDQAICEAVQRNLDAGVYEDGVLAPRHERGVAAFQRWVLGARGACAERTRVR